MDGAGSEVGLPLQILIPKPSRPQGISHLLLIPRYGSFAVLSETCTLHRYSYT